MRKILLMIAVLFACTTTFGQLTGFKNIPGDYATIAIAVDSLNTHGVGSGGVTFNVSPTYIDTITAPILITATGTASNPIIFQGAPETSMASPLVVRKDAGTIATSVAEAQGDAIIIIQGGDYITFDAINLQALQSTIEYGYYLRRASVTDGCKHVTIKNSTITMNKGTNAFVIGIYSSNNDINSLTSVATGVTVTSEGGRTENLVITGNTITNVYGGIAIRGYSHATAPNNFQDLNNVVGVQYQGNTITNFGGNSAGTCFGVHLYCQTSPNISYNTINNVADGGTNSIGGTYAIWHQLSNNVGDFVANNNTLTLGMAAASSGGTFIQATPTGINSNTIHIENNTFEMPACEASGTVWYINCNGAKADNVTVTGNSTVGTVTRNTASSSIFGYQNTGATHTGGTHTISNNNFSNMLLNSTTAFRGIDSRTGSGSNNVVVNIITNNTISNITSGSTVYGVYQSFGITGSIVSNNVITGLINSGVGTSGNNVVSGMMLGSNGASSDLAVYDNTITNLRGTESVYGIWNQAGTNNRIFRNNINNIKNNATSIGPVYGMIVNAGTTTTIYNNFISDLTAPYSNGDYVIMGIYIAGGSFVNFYNNSIYIHATSTAATFGTVGVYAQAAVKLDMRNNVIVNQSSHQGNTGFTVAFRRSSAIMDNYVLTSNNNDFYAMSNSPTGNYFFCDGTSSLPVTVRDSTLAQYQALVYPRDTVSFSELPPFVNNLTAPYDLHLKTIVPTHCESGAGRITTPVAVSSDYDQNIRWGETGYTGTGTAPDVGADEFNGIRNYTPMTLSAVSTSTVCPTSNNGSVNLTVSGGLPPFTYLWSNGATTKDIAGLPAGTYTVTVTDNTTAQVSNFWKVNLAGLVCDSVNVSGTIGTSGCYDANKTITVSGLTVSAPNGHVELIAGEKILITPGMTVQNGAWLWAHISTTFCTQPTAPMMATGTGNDAPKSSLSNSWFSIYPNPTSGNFTIVQKGNSTYSNVQVEVYSMNGSRVMSDQIIGSKSHELEASSLPTGIYFVRIIADNYSETLKLVKTK